MSYTSLLNNIKALANNPNTKLDEVLKLDYITFFYNQGVPCLIQFLAAKSEELLKSSIECENDTIRSKSFEIICGDNTDIIQSMISRQIIAKVTEKYIFDDSTDKVILHRIINIFERCFSVDFVQSSNQLYFITEFNRFLQNENVVGFFEDCSEQPIFGKKFIQWLNELEFDDKLIDTLQNESKIENPEFLNGLYSMLDKSIMNEEVRPRFLTPSKLSILIQPCNEKMPDFVKITHAKMILDLCNEKSIQFISDILGYLTNIVFCQKDVDFSNDNEENKKNIEKNLSKINEINQLYLLCYQILIKIFTIDNCQRNYFALSILVDVAFFILNNFQNHSFALIVASNFIIQCSKINSPIRSYSISRFIPFAKVNLETNKNLNITAFIYKIMIELHNNDWSNLNKDNFNLLYEKFIEPKKTIIDTQYGGEAPPPQVLNI